tara:strand:- start:321 stop:3152 length:2832 start_codon:yes stop_codon:yes gene_type:complete
MIEGHLVNIVKTKKIFCELVFFIICISIGNASFAQTSLGSIIPNTNKALPSSYNFQEYVFPEPNDEGVCTGAKNESAVIGEIFLSQTHRLDLTSQLFFTIGYRPALFQVAVTGSGKSPDVKILGFHGDEAIGTLCLKGPANLSNTVNTSVPDFENYFSVTIPKSWIRPDLTLDLYVDDQLRTLSKEELKIGPYTELNLVMLEMDVLNYNNTEAHKWPIIKNFLQEVASAFPASVVRYGEFPVRLKFPELIASNGTENLVRLRASGDKLSNNITSDGSINSVMSLFLTSLHRSTGDFLSTFYFGNTLNLAPGGWGGGKSFVSFNFDDVFVHELGHALSLPHWGEAAWDINPTKWQYLYPYSGDAGYGTSTEAKGGGRGESWNFIQDIYEFINPICQFNARGKAGLETSDAMQRNNHCLEARSNSKGPWDGFGDFSALAMHRYLVGAAQKNGQVWYKGGARDFQLVEQEGFPVVSLEDGKRIYTRDPIQVVDVGIWSRKEERLIGLGNELIESDAYLIYGTTHPTQPDANIVYEPVKFTGTIPAIIDPTDPKTIEDLKTDSRYETLFGEHRDITLKMYYEDGSTLHAINSSSSFTRPEDYSWGFHIWRNDLDNFALVVPGDKKLSRVELYHRPFHMSSPWNSNGPGHINDKENPITAENFMSAAVLKASFPPEKKSLAAGSIGNLVWYDLNKNGKHDEGEPGIPGVSVYLWGDTDGDNIPDVGVPSGAVTVTDSNGNYRFIGLAPGPYRAFVWQVNNWGVFDPLNGMVSTSLGVPNPDNDTDNDSNGCFRGATVKSGTVTCSSLKNYDISTGIINLSASGEPLNDGDLLSNAFLDYDASGNMTIDFGFHYENPTSFYLNGILVIPNLLADGSNYYVELELMDLPSATFKLKTIKDADLDAQVFATLLGDGSIEIPQVLINRNYYKVGLSISTEPLVLTAIYAEKL